MNTLKINGEEKRFDGGLPATLSQLLAYLKLDEATVVAEIDDAIIERSKFSATTLCDGQKIELIRFVGGG
ncbi:MAG: sulfur carrier protein ThiS [Sedimentisphaerales bacterium]|nr:sulfur carrier protein ThiS [Sedimentisphaerales bacterium]